MADNTDNTILHELLELQKESNERDSRIENKMDNINTRMGYIEERADKQDKQIDKLTEILSDQKILAHNVDSLTESVNNHSQRITELENKDGKAAVSAWNKIAWIIASTALTTLVGFIVGKFLN